MSKAVKRVGNPNLIATGHLIRLLEDNTSLDNRELAELTGLTYLTVNRYTAAWYHAKAVHIAAWKRDNRGAQTIRVYALGAKVDAKAQVLTHAEKMRVLRRKWKHERTEQGVRVTALHD